MKETKLKGSGKKKRVSKRDKSENPRKSEPVTAKEKNNKENVNLGFSPCFPPFRLFNFPTVENQRQGGKKVLGMLVMQG